MESGDRTALVRICDPAGRPRGTGFVADDRGTVLTSHEAVAGLARSVLHGAGGRSRIVEAGDITALPELDLALLPTAGPGELGVEPVPIALRDRIDAGTYVTIAAHGWREARVLGTAPVTYTAHGRSHRIGAALELALGTDGRDALRLGGAAVGGPVLDPESGAVIAVLGSALRAGHPGAFAVPLWAAGTGGPLDALLRRNATSVPGYGRDLNLAGALHLTATSLGSSDGPAACPDPVERPDVVAEFTAFESPDRAATASDGPAVVLGLVGAPGTGRTTELAALTARRARGPVPAPTLWLRGADLLADDTSVADAIARALRRAGRIVTAAGVRGDMASATPERVARLAEESGSPLLVLLDGPEEMPPALAHEPARWTDATVAWLRENGARLVIASGPEHWETAGALCPPEALHRPAGPAGRLPAAVRLGDLTAVQAERARERYAIPPGALAPGHDRHPLTLRLLAEVRAALPGDVAGRPDTEEVFGAHLDLMCLRVAVRIAAASGPAPGAARSAGWPPGWRGRSTRRRGAVWAPDRGSWTGRRSRRSSPGARAGRRPSSPRACSSRRASATASRTRSWGTGCRAPTWTWTRHCTRWSTGGMRRRGRAKGRARSRARRRPDAGSRGRGARARDANRPRRCPHSRVRGGTGHLCRTRRRGPRRRPGRAPCPCHVIASAR